MNYNCMNLSQSGQVVLEDISFKRKRLLTQGDGNPVSLSLNMLKGHNT